MYLYDGNKKEIKVYGFWPKKFGRCLIDYKKSEMEKIDVTKRVLKAVTNEKVFPLHFDNLSSEINFSDINYETKKLFNKSFHKIESYKHQFDYEYYSSLDGFYDGIYIHSPIIVVHKDEACENWIITKKSYLMYRDEYVLDGIINIPDNLRDLRELEAGNFANLTNKQIQKYAMLFTFKKEPIAIYDRSLIRDLVRDEVVENKITGDILERDSEIIKRLAKIYK